MLLKRFIQCLMIIKEILLVHYNPNIMDGSEYNNLLRYLTKKEHNKILQLMKRGH
jgi:hypothetical protein